MTHRISAEICKQSGAAFCLAPPIGGALVRQNAKMAFLVICLLPRLPSVVVRRRSSSITKWAVFISKKTVSSRIIKIYTDIHTDLLYSQAWYDITSYFRSVANWISILTKIDKSVPGRVIHETQFANATAIMEYGLAASCVHILLRISEMPRRSTWKLQKAYLGNSWHIIRF